MRVVRATNDVEVREQDGRFLLIIKPDLEECFRRCMGRVGLESKLPGRADELRRGLGIPGTRLHQIFRQELDTLSQESRHRRIQTFVTDLEDTVRNLPDC